MKKAGEITSKEKLDFLTDNLSNDLLYDDELANEYLVEEGYKHEDIQNGLDQLKSMISKMKLSVGRKKQQWYETKMIDFRDKTKGLSREQVHSMYPALPSIAARQFDDEKLSPEELDSLLTDASFLSFLDAEYDQETE